MKQLVECSSRVLVSVIIHDVSITNGLLQSAALWLVQLVYQNGPGVQQHSFDVTTRHFAFLYE